MVPKRVIHALILVISLPLSSSTLIDDTCKQTPNSNLCESILKANPKSPTADLHGLALIVVENLESQANKALETINQYLKTTPDLKVPLTQCLKNYNTILKYTVTEAVEALTKGNPKFAEDATKDAAFEANECEDGFKSFSSSPISGIDKVFHDVADIATSIIRLLL